MGVYQVASSMLLSRVAKLLLLYYLVAAAAAAKSLQSGLILCNPIDGSPPGSPVPGILQARTLEWVVISFSNAWKWKVKGKSLSHVWLLATPWTAAHQALPSMGFSRQEYWSGVPLPSSTTWLGKVNSEILLCGTSCQNSLYTMIPRVNMRILPLAKYSFKN